MEWTDFNDYAVALPLGRGLPGNDTELGSSPPDFSKALWGWRGSVSSQAQEELGVEPILRPGGVYRR